MSADIRPLSASGVPAILPLVEQYWLFEDIAGFDPARIGRELERACADERLASQADNSRSRTVMLSGSVSPSAESRSTTSA